MTYKCFKNSYRYYNLNFFDYSNNPLPDGAVTLLPAAANSNAKKLPTPPPTTPTPPMTTTATAASVVATPVVVVASKNETEPSQIKPSVSVTLVPVYSGEGAGNGANGAIETPLNLSTTPPQVLLYPSLGVGKKLRHFLTTHIIVLILREIH